jgi:hypothetical protein
MPKRDSRARRTTEGSMPTDASSATTTADAMEQRVIAFAEQLGRIAGTFQARAEGLMDRDVVKKQIAEVRDGAADLLAQITGGAKTVSRKKAAGAAAPAGTRRRSGGVVDAPGKKHRKPIPSDPDANARVAQAAKMRTAMTMVKTNRRRGRG